MIHNIGDPAMNVDRDRQDAIDHSAQGTTLSRTNSNIYTGPNAGGTSAAPKCDMSLFLR